MLLASYLKMKLLHSNMKSDFFSYDRCHSTVSILSSLFISDKKLSQRISFGDITQLGFSCNAAWEAGVSDGVSEPMVWIGIYIAIASFFCILAMTADLLYGFQNKKFWFPCKYFSLNAASLTVIAVAMKLPVDLTSGASSFVELGSKLGSLAFMCVMMANFMPSLASMDNKKMLANLIGLGILVITVIVNICIQIYTGVIFHLPLAYRSKYFYGLDFRIIALIYMAMILMLLVIMISSSLTIPTYKETLESKYQVMNKLFLTDQCLQHTQRSIVEKLRQQVRRFWVMAETGSPQFVMARNPLSSASGVICVAVLLMHSLTVFTIHFRLRRSHIRAPESPYKWSTPAIFITQSIGVVVGTIAPVFRCFSVLRFKLVTSRYNNHFMNFKVEKYWTQKLYEWKQSLIPFLSMRRRTRSLTCKSKDISLSLCIGFQKVVVVSCKLIWLMATVVPVCVINCLHHWKGRWLTPIPVTTRNDDKDEDLRDYVLQIDNEMDLAEKTLKSISNSVNFFILKAGKEELNNLLALLKKSTGFEGVEIFDTDQVQSLLSVEPVNSWSLPIVTLTCIAVALPNIPMDTIESLLRSVGEGLSFTHLVEESLNSASEYVNIWKTAMTLWYEVENKCKWLDNPLVKNNFQGKTTTEILKWFSDKAKEIVTGINESTNGESVENAPKTLIVANSMYRITQTILLRFQSKTYPITKKQLFAYLNGMIADIFCACFTNIPQVITTRCHESVIEKREASVRVASKLLGKTTRIIERLETCDKVPSMDDEKMAYIDEWRLYLKQSIP